MRRRTLLSTASALLVPSLAGCLADSILSGDPESETRDLEIPDSLSDYPMSTQEGFDFGEYDPAATYDELEIGSRDGIPDGYGPYTVRIWNAAGEPTVGFGLVDLEEESVVHNDLYSIPDDEELTVTLLKPSNYLVTVYVSEKDTEQTVQVSCRSFDCNESSTRIGILEDGTIKAVARTTVVYCASGCWNIA